MNIRKIMVVVVAVAMAAGAFADVPTIGNVKAQQRYPWNGLVDIDYTITGDTTGLNLSFSARDTESGATYRPMTFLSTPSSSAGANRATWNPKADGYSIVSSNIVVSVLLTRTVVPPTPPVQDAEYLVIDLSGGPSATSYPVSSLSEVPSGGWSEEYKTTKLVLRKLAGGTFNMSGSTSTTITKPFYIGVFEVTQKQYELVTGSNPCSSASYGKGDAYPAHGVSYDMVRGSSDGAGWPASSAVDADSFLGKIQPRTGLGLDLPTEAQWEYACRAGTTTTYSYGDAANGDYMWYVGNSGWKSYAVGSKLPNAFGLYDMHGNVWEWCLDWSGTLVGGNDPKGAASGSVRAMRGGSWCNSAYDCTSSYCDKYGSPDAGDPSRGFRLCCAAAE